MQRAKPGLGAVVPALAMLALAGGCSEKSAPESAPAAITTAQKPAPPAPAAAEPVDLVAEGRATYLGNCIACHNPDPTQDGALGPAIAGSSPALVEARVMRAEYPAGYTPKRETKAMIAMPFLEKKIPALAAYLQSIAPRS